MVTRRARAYEARVRARRFRAGLSPGPDQEASDLAAQGGGGSGGVGEADVGAADVGHDEAPRAGDPAPSPAPPGVAAPLFAGTVQVVDGEPFTVRTVTGAAAAKTYVCPRCLQTIPPRFPHLVVWPVHTRLDGTEGLSVRRHWHRHCWASHVRTTTGGRRR